MGPLHAKCRTPRVALPSAQGSGNPAVKSNRNVSHGFKPSPAIDRGWQHVPTTSRWPPLPLTMIAISTSIQ